MEFKTQVTFEDGLTVKLGDRVRFRTVHGGSGVGIVESITKTKGVRIHVRPVGSWLPGALDYWKLGDGSHYSYPLDAGLCGGEIQGVERE